MYETSLKILKKIEEPGFKAYIVGGFSRDLYLGKESTDVDICTNATPKDLKELFKGIILPNEQYGSVTVIFHKIHFEITTFREDIKYLDNRHPSKVRYINDLLKDLKRRDFTINTICINSEGAYIDLLGGLKDIDARVIKMIGNPKTRLKEDSLRILRAIRFATTLNFQIDNELKKYIKKYGSLLKKLSYYRKKEELNKIFASSNVSIGIDLIKKLKLDKPLELNNLDKLKITTQPLGIWAQLDVLNKYTFTANEKDIIVKINELMNKDLFDLENLYKYGLYISTIVGEIKGIDKKKVVAAYNDLYIQNKLDIAISPEKICEVLNKKPGAFLKTILTDLEHKLIKKELLNEESLLINYILENY